MTSRFFSFVFCIFFLFLSPTPSPIAAQESSQEYSGEDLHKAAKDGDLELVRKILDGGVSVDAKTKYEATALSFAAERGHLEIVKLLVGRGADINNKDTFYNATPLTWATMGQNKGGQHKETLEFLKEKSTETGSGRSNPDSSKTGDDKKTDQKKSNEKNSDDKKLVDSEAETDDGRKPADMNEAEGSENESAESFQPSSDASKMADREVSSSNWPQFRGMAARGVADGQNPPLSWNHETGEGLAWETDISGLGHSCPAVWEDKIFLTSAISSANNDSIQIGNYGQVDSVDDSSMHQFVVLAINKSDGEILWQKTAIEAVPKVKRHLKSTHANPTIACNDSVIVAFFGSEGLYCYSHQGDLLWEQQLGFLDSGWFYDADYQWGFAASPVIFEDTVIVQCDIQKDSFIAAYNLMDGTIKWKTDRDEIPGWSCPTIYYDGERALIATNGTRGIRGYDAKTGDEVWSFAAENSEIVTPTPFVSQDKIIVCAGYSPIMPIYAISTRAKGDLTLEKTETSSEFVAWSHRRGGPYMPSPIAYGDYLYVCSNIGRLACYHLPTGKQVYQERLKGKKSVSFVASPVAADGYLYFTSENGQVLVVKSGPKFEQVFTNQTEMKVLASPAISDGMLLIRGQNKLQAYKTQ